MGGVARVVLDSPLTTLDRLFDYAIPDGMHLAPGMRVRVPVRAARRVLDGFVVDTAEASGYGGPLAAVDRVVSETPVLATEVWALARAVADRAAGTASDVLRLAVPRRQARAESAWCAHADREPVAARPVRGYVEDLGRAVEAGERLAVRAVPRPGAWAHTLAELASVVVARGQHAILVVPDLRDVAAVAAAVEAAGLGDRLARLDADQPPAARYRQFLKARFEEGVVVVGTRSAVYAPAARLGLLAIWDDGDPLHQEPRAPGVHPRDAALIRHEQQGGALVLLGNTVSTHAQRLVELGWLRPVGASVRPPRVLPTALQPGDRLAQAARIPSTAWRAASDALQHGPVLVQVARPGDDPAGALRTAADLGRAFPRARVVVADADHRLERVGDDPALVIATRGAEPVAGGGYRCVLLLDADRMLARESLQVAEDAMRAWSNAAVLAAPEAPVHLVGAEGRLARWFATWAQDRFAAAELADRRAARMPPAVRTVTLTGAPDAVADAVAATAAPASDVIGPLPVDDGRVRTVVRFDYRHGAAVAHAIRTELLRHATGRRQASRAASGARPPSPALRAVFDDPEPFTGERAIRRTVAGDSGTMDG